MSEWSAQREARHLFTIVEDDVENVLSSAYEEGKGEGRKEMLDEVIEALHEATFLSGDELTKIIDLVDKLEGKTVS